MNPLTGCGLRHRLTLLTHLHKQYSSCSIALGFHLEAKRSHWSDVGLLVCLSSLLLARSPKSHQTGNFFFLSELRKSTAHIFSLLRYPPPPTHTTHFTNRHTAIHQLCCIFIEHYPFSENLLLLPFMSIKTRSLKEDKANTFSTTLGKPVI